MPKPLPIVWHLDTKAINKQEESLDAPDRLTRIALVMEAFENDQIGRQAVKDQIDAILKS